MEAALNYNEQKAQKGKAICLLASGYFKEATEMNYYEKLAGLERSSVWNERATTKTLHVSLNFDPSEKLSDDTLKAIAESYMEKIGFGKQPFLVYKHEDAGHPHIHIVSTTIRDDGTRINTHNIGRNQSEKARKELEQAFRLVKAEKQRQSSRNVLRPVDPQKALYGKGETKGAIAAVVTTVFNQYKFGSLPEYNAVLYQFNVVAERGKEGGRIYNHRGLVYRILNGSGQKVGVPIKASLFGCKPTLANLEQKFMQNGVAKEPMKARVKEIIEACFSKSVTIAQFTASLKVQNIMPVLRQNDLGIVYGITYVDNDAKCVFNGSDLGKGYSAAAVQGRLSAEADNKKQENAERAERNEGSTKEKRKMQGQKAQHATAFVAKRVSVLDILLSAKEQNENVPANLLNKKRKKKRRRDNNS